jgi:hypothetical protein
MEAGATSLIHGLFDSLVVSIVLPKIESLQLKCEVSYTLGTLLVLNKTWSTFIQTREKYIEMLEEWWEGERQWTIHNFFWHCVIEIVGRLENNVYMGCSYHQEYEENCSTSSEI